jgi:hypothetical protein
VARGWHVIARSRRDPGSSAFAALPQGGINRPAPSNALGFQCENCLHRPQRARQSCRNLLTHPPAHVTDLQFLDCPGVPSMMSAWLGRPPTRVLLATPISTTLLKAPETPRDFGLCDLDLPQVRPGEKRGSGCERTGFLFPSSRTPASVRLLFALSTESSGMADTCWGMEAACCRIDRQSPAANGGASRGGR